MSFGTPTSANPKIFLIKFKCYMNHLMTSKSSDESLKNSLLW